MRVIDGGRSTAGPAALAVDRPAGRAAVDAAPGAVRTPPGGALDTDLIGYTMALASAPLRAAIAAHYRAPVSAWTSRTRTTSVT